MSYHDLSECTLSPAERLEEAGRIINMLTAADETYFKLSLKERSFIDSLQTSCSVKQLFWLRDIWERVPIYMVVSAPADTYDILSAWTTNELANEALAKAIDEEDSDYFKRFL